VSCVRTRTSLPAPVIVRMPLASTEEIGKHIDDIEKNVIQASIRTERIKTLLDNLYEK
jgi:hypothetical protein